MKVKCFLMLCLCCCTNLSFSCTHFKLQAEDKSIIIGRSMEFGPNLKTDIYTVSRGAAFKSTTPDNKPGLHWRAKHGYIALDGFHLFPVSGLNEQGLSFDALYLPGLAEYETYESNSPAEAMPYYQLADYILGNFSDISEIKQALPKLTIYGKALEHAGKQVVFPLHFMVTDAQGQGLVIEMTKGKLHLYENELGILTNSPSYPWQQTNLSNYINLSPYAPHPILKDGITYNATGQGAGAIGLPGDYTPPSRFVRMAYLVNTSKPMPNASQTVNLAEHLLNNVDIPLGAVRGPKENSTKDSMDKTQWVIIKDLTHHVLYFRSYSDLSLHKIDMKQLNFEPDAPKQRIKLASDQAHIIDVTNQLK